MEKKRTGSSLASFPLPEETFAMARANGFILDTGTPFPVFEFPELDGQRIVLPRDFEGRWAVLLFYRGHW
jgi:hypothetical protein